MAEGVSRRAVLHGLAAGVVVGFDPRSRSWVTEAHAASSLVALPQLDGTLSVDPATIEAFSEDFGHIVERKPVAVLVPGSVLDVAAMVRYANRHRLKIAMRGQGHTQFGQAGADCGVVIDSRGLSTIHEIAPGRAVVDAGVLWSELFHAALTQGLTPPVLTDYLELAVGGTLSVGGIGGSSQHAGLTADTALELQVVTGEGDLVTCSPRHRRDLFETALTGLGQAAIIVRATLSLVPAESDVLLFHLFYDDVTTYVQDQLRLIRERRFSYLEGQVVANPEGGWSYMIEAAQYYTAPATPDPGQLLAGLRDDRTRAEVLKPTYSEFAFRLAPTIEFLKANGLWELPHPWFSVFVPASRAASYVGATMDARTIDDTGQGPVLFYPMDSRRIRSPFFPLPEGQYCFAFNILRTAIPPTADTVLAMVADNRALYDALRAIGGTKYTPSAIPFSPRDWQSHFGSSWRRFVAMKRRYDPNNVLTPGQQIFLEG